MSDLLSYAYDHVFATGTRPDGYFGERCSCKFTLLPQRANMAMEQLDNGVYALCLVNPDGSVCGIAPSRFVVSVAEALWYLENDPRFTSRYTVDRLTSIASY